MIVAGFGFRGIATTQSLRDALAQTGSHAPTLLAAPADKAYAPSIQQLAQELGLSVFPVPATLLQSAQTLTHSPKAQEHRATGSVAEACALAAAGTNATLLATRQISTDRRATCALAQGSPA